jgi:ketosteroid isomerase-like protein
MLPPVLQGGGAFGKGGVMSVHPGVAQAHRYLDTFAAGDRAALLEFFTDDVVWRVAGAHPLSGTYRGHGEVCSYFEKVQGLTGDSMVLEPESILSSDTFTSILARVRASRDGRDMDVVLAQVLKREADGRWSEYWALADDQRAVDEFWS